MQAQVAALVGTGCAAQVWRPHRRPAAAACALWLRKYPTHKMTVQRTRGMKANETDCLLSANGEAAT